MQNHDYRVEFNPACLDWMLQSGFDGSSWPQVYRHKSLEEMLVVAREKSDGICWVSLRPASQEEIEEEDRDQAEYERRESGEASARVRRLQRAELVGLAVQVIFTLASSYWGFRATGLKALCLLGVAALPATNLLWPLARLVRNSRSQREARVR